MPWQEHAEDYGRINVSVLHRATHQELEEEPGILVGILPANPSADHHLQGYLLVELLQVCHTTQ